MFKFIKRILSKESNPVRKQEQKKEWIAPRTFDDGTTENCYHWKGENGATYWTNVLPNPEREATQSALYQRMGFKSGSEYRQAKKEVPIQYAYTGFRGRVDLIHDSEIVYKYEWIGSLKKQGSKWFAESVDGSIKLTAKTRQDAIGSIMLLTGAITTEDYSIRTLGEKFPATMIQ